MTKKPYILMILDGWGIGKKNSSNAIHIAETPFLDKIIAKYPKTELTCSGHDVGLPDGIMGNSEVGHMNIGAGRIVYQDLLRIDKDISDGSFHNNKILNNTMNKAILKKSSLHFIGLLSDGGVHSQINHLYALLNLAKKKNIENIFIHPIMDGRDTQPNTGIKYLQELQSYIEKIGCCAFISTICGRYYAMDRDKRWNRIERAYQLYTQGIGKVEKDPVEAVRKAYLNGETDEFIQPIKINNIFNKKDGLLHDDDVIIFFNFRADRAREISYSLIQPQFKPFHRKVFPKLSDYLTMTLYDPNLNVSNIFPPAKMENLMGEVISRNGLNQLRIAETEKYAHVTYFFNGGEEKLYSNEDRCLIPSPRDVDTYDQKPEMSAFLVTEEVLKRIELNYYDFIVLNFANMDMVGHTGSINAATKACEVIDSCVKKIVTKVKAKNGIAIITADHGNAEKMADIDGNPFTAHTKNKVPFVVVGKNLKEKRIRNYGSLSDIAPTILDIMQIKKPEVMTGQSLFEL